MLSTRVNAALATRRRSQDARENKRGGTHSHFLTRNSLPNTLPGNMWHSRIVWGGWEGLWATFRARAGGCAARQAVSEAGHQARTHVGGEEKGAEEVARHVRDAVGALVGLVGQKDRRLLIHSGRSCSL